MNRDKHMRIRTKLSMVELILVVGFLLAFGVVLFYNNTVFKLKDFQISSNNVMSAMRQMNAQTRSLLTTKAPVIQMSVAWTNTITAFERELNSLSEYSSLRVLTKDQQTQLAETTGWWEQIYSWYYFPTIMHLQQMQRSGAAAAVGGDGILQTLLELEAQEGDPPDFIGEFYTVQNYQDLIIQETQVFSDRLSALTTDIQGSIEENIQRSTQIVIALLLFTLIVTVLITSRFSHLIGSRIRKVEQAIRNIAQGDFSTELRINSKDELEDLSHNYNILKNQLQEKLNSVLDFMLSISTSLSEGPNLDTILQLISESAGENTTADGVAVYMVDSESDKLVPKALWGDFIPPYNLGDDEGIDPQKAQRLAESREIELGETVIGQAVKKATPVFVKEADALRNGTLDYHRDGTSPLYIHSLIVTPLVISKRLLGAIVIEKKEPPQHFTDLDFTHMQTFADYAALTIDNIFNYEELIEKREMHREIEIAADIQRDLLPRELPEMKSLQISAFSRAARGISGDYYDVFSINKHKIGVVICDVVGKGVPASLLMVMIRTIIRLVTSPQRTPAQLLTLLNRGIIGRVGTEHFATISILTFDEKNRELTYSNAAHPPLLLYRAASRDFVEIDTPGLPIGIEQNEQYQEKTVTTEKDDILVLYTDGIPETRSPDGREYGNDKLKESLKQLGKKSAREIAQKIQQGLDDFTEEAEQHDDQTLVILKVKK